MPFNYINLKNYNKFTEQEDLFKKFKDKILNRQIVGDYCEYSNFTIYPATLVALTLVLTNGSSIDKNSLKCMPRPEWINIPDSYLENLCLYQGHLRVSPIQPDNNQFSEPAMQLSGDNSGFSYLDHKRPSVPMLYLYAIIPASIGAHYILVERLTMCSSEPGFKHFKLQKFVKSLSTHINNQTSILYLIKKLEKKRNSDKKIKKLIINLQKKLEHNSLIEQHRFEVISIRSFFSARRTATNLVNIFWFSVFFYYVFGRSEILISPNLVYRGFVQPKATCLVSIDETIWENNAGGSKEKVNSRTYKSKNLQLDCIVPSANYVNYIIVFLILFNMMMIIGQLLRAVSNFEWRMKVNSGKEQQDIMRDYDLYMCLGGEVSLNRVKMFMEYEKEKKINNPQSSADVLTRKIFELDSISDSKGVDMHLGENII